MPMMFAVAGGVDVDVDVRASSDLARAISRFAAAAAVLGVGGKEVRLAKWRAAWLATVVLGLLLLLLLQAWCWRCCCCCCS